MSSVPESERSLAQMLVTLINNQEREQTRVSRILHDDVGQVLTAVGLHLDVLRMDFEAMAPGLAARVTELQKVLEHAVVRVRDLSFELNPAIVEKAGLSAALDRLAGRFRARCPGSLRLLADSSVRLPFVTANAIYKIVEAALDNAIRHADASQIEVLMKPAQKGGTVEIRDNGKGFDLEKSRQHVSGLGILLMEYYASQSGMQLSIKSEPGHGTIVRAIHQLRESARPQAGN